MDLYPPYPPQKQDTKSNSAHHLTIHTEIHWEKGVIGSEIAVFTMRISRQPELTLLMMLANFAALSAAINDFSE